MQFLTRRDRFLIAAVLGCAAVLAVWFYILPFMMPPSGNDDLVCVTIDGESYGTWPLSEDHEEDIDTPYGHNHLTIRDGSAQMTEADCPDGLCMHQGRISRPGEMIVCLPHRVIAEVISRDGTSQGYDSISQ